MDIGVGFTRMTAVGRDVAREGGSGGGAYMQFNQTAREDWEGRQDWIKLQG